MPMVSLKLMAGAAIRMVVWVSRCLWRTPRISIFEDLEPTTIHRQKNPRGKWEKISRNAS